MIEDLFKPEVLLILLVIIFFLFGAQRLPGLAKSMGRGIHEFRSGIAGITDAEPDELPAGTTPGTPADAPTGTSADAPTGTSADADDPGRPPMRRPTPART